MNRTDLSHSFYKAAQTLEESTDSARKMLESLQQDGKLLIAPRKETMKENKTQCSKHKIGNWYYYKNKPFEVGTLVFTNIDDAKTEAAKRSKSREHSFASSITQELQPGIYG